MLNRDTNTQTKSSIRYTYKTGIDLRSSSNDSSSSNDTYAACSAPPVSKQESYHVYREEEEITYMVPVPKIGTPKGLSLTPITIMVVDTIGTKKSRDILKVLLDPGSTKTLINKKSVPRGAKTKTLGSENKVSTIAGTMKPKALVNLCELKLPEFDKNRRVDEIQALIFEGKCRYDAILGADFLTKTGIDLNYSTRTMHWFENVRPMVEPWKLDNKDYQAMAMSHDIQAEEELLGEDWLDSFAAMTILDAKYEKVDIHEVATSQAHLDKDQQIKLEQVLAKYTKLFDGTLGVYPHKKFSIEIKPDSVPKHSRPYSIPQVHLEAFKTELDHLVRIGVLSKAGTSEWGSPTFIIPEKDGRIRWISDLHELNNVVVR